MLGLATALERQYMKIAVLDDYQGVSLDYGDWTGIQNHAEIVIFRHNIGEPSELIRELQVSGCRTAVSRSLWGQ